MQLFILHTNPLTAASMHMDVHVISQIRETVQLLCTVAYLRGADKDELKERIHGPTHEHHPCVHWLNESYENIGWTLLLLEALHAEYLVRYDKPLGTTHASYRKLHENARWVQQYLDKVPHVGITPFALAMQQNPECIVEGDAVQSYRNFYHTKRGGRFETWRNGAPDWWQA